MSFNHSIYFLCKKPNQDLIEFSKEILDENFCNVFIVVDDNSFYFEDKMFLQFDDKLCIDKNYTNLNPSISTKPTAWNKVVYHLCEESQDNFSIIIEDDVFIGPNVTISSNCRIGNHVLIQTGAIVGHDSYVGDWTRLDSYVVVLMY